MSVHGNHDLDCTNSSRGLWLVKIPKYMKEKWAELPGSTNDVGRLKITKNPGTLPSVTFSLGDNLLKDAKLPREHKFILHSVKEQTLGVFSQSLNSNGEGVVTDGEKVYMEGQVIQKFECQPVVDSNYLQLKRDATKKASIPESQVKSITRPAPTFRPRSNHDHIIKMENRKKQEGKKARDDKDKVLEKLFSAFESHQYYNIRDLEKITRQPITYLKEILKEVCDYNVKNPHKNMWELKPEYRHYKDDKKGGSDSD